MQGKSFLFYDILNQRMNDFKSSKIAHHQQAKTNKLFDMIERTNHEKNCGLEALHNGRKIREVHIPVQN